MTNLKKMFSLAALLTLLSLTASAQSTPVLNEQGGDIKEGKVFNLKPFSMVSYYKDGKSERVKFTCTLTGTGAQASLSPGKNFEGNSYKWLRVGVNGPYIWTLHDRGYNNGNIKVTLAQGTDVKLQCILVD